MPQRDLIQPSAVQRHSGECVLTQSVVGLDDWPMSLADGVAMRMTLLTCTSKGTLDRRRVVDGALRAAMLADVIFERGSSESTDAFELDCSPTGFAPADRLLDGIRRWPDLPLMHWLERGPSIHKALLSEWIARDDVEARRMLLGTRYELGARALSQVAKARSLVSDFGSVRLLSAEQATLVVLAMGCGLGSEAWIGGVPSDALITCGGASTIVTAFADLRPKYLMTAAAGGGGGSAQ